MAATTARTKEDVNNMSKADRIWDSLNYSYGKKRESSDREYDKAISQADRQALTRGMQRSSYNNQVLGNLGNQKVQAQNDIWDAQIADYEARLGEAEQQDLENERWERQFAAEREDAQWNKDYQQQQADRSQANWQMQFDADRGDTAWNQAFQQAQADTSKDQWERQFGYGQQSDAQQIAMQYAMSILQNGNMPSDDLLARAGLSRPDAEALMAKAKGGSGRGSGNGSGNGNGEDSNGANGTTTTGNPDQDFLNLLGGSDANILYSMNVPAINKGNTQTKNTAVTGNYLKRK